MQLPHARAHAAALCPPSQLLLPLAVCSPLQLLAWMDNPVPASRVALKCEKPTDIKADNVCETYVG